MAHYGTLRDYRFADAEATDDIRGSSVYGRDDEKLGKIDDVIFDHATGNIQYVVIDTGGWLSSKKFIIPPDRLRDSAKHKDDFQMSATKKQVEAFPPLQRGRCLRCEPLEGLRKALPGGLARWTRPASEGVGSRHHANTRRDAGRARLHRESDLGKRAGRTPLTSDSCRQRRGHNPEQPNGNRRTLVEL